MADITERKLRRLNPRLSKFLDTKSDREETFAAGESAMIKFSFYEERSRNGLRIWLVLVSMFTFACGLQSFKSKGKFLSEKIYTVIPDQVNPIMSRIFGMLMFFFALVRFYYAVDIKNNLLLQVTSWSFAVQLLHLLVETFIYRTTVITFGNVVSATLLVSAVSLMWLIIHAIIFKANK